MTAFLQNLFVFLRASPRIARYCLSGRWLAAGAGKPAGEHRIPDDFFGLCVASNEDAAWDDFIVERLKELGMNRVRLDFTYHSRGQYGERFLRRLIDEKFRVCLHLVQPRSEAAQMQESVKAQDDWREFLAEIFSAYGQKVELIEIGSTCNRRKWSGYTLPSYLTAWQIACEAASAQNCKLAAPNVTDFEPVYNIAVLNEMKRKNLLPAAHTDNLFVERATEPEVYDRKIAGKHLAGIFKFDFIRKARVLNDIARTFGVPKTVCSHVSWSLRRIERFLEAAEEKQADYLARYCCLAAASGALEQVYWGPLIGQREGLIDDGTTEFPEIPHVTYYARARGNISGYRIRPAYYAFQTMNRFLAGAKYIRKIPSEHSLEIHEFGGADGFFHVAWTMNGRRALTRECYPADILGKAQCYSRDGVFLDNPPPMISESPLYVMWFGEVLDSKDVARHGVAHSPHTVRRYNKTFLEHMFAGPDKLRTLKNIRFANVAGIQYDFVTRADLSGVCRIGDEDRILNLASALNVAGTDDKAENVLILRDARNRVWRCALPGRETKIVMKLFRPPGYFKRLLQLKKGDKALRSWNGAHDLLRRGVSTPLPVAFFHHAERPVSSESWYVCGEFAGSFSVRNAFTAFSDGADKFKGLKADKLYSQIGFFLVKMHDRGVYFRDLSAGNLLFRFRSGHTMEFALIDTARALFYDKSIGLRQRLCDLMRICHPLCWKGRKVFLATYMALIGRHYRAWMNIAFHYYDFKHWVKRQFRFRRG